QSAATTIAATPAARGCSVASRSTSSRMRSPRRGSTSTSRGARMRACRRRRRRASSSSPPAERRSSRIPSPASSSGSTPSASFASSPMPTRRPRCTASCSRIPPRPRSSAGAVQTGFRFAYEHGYDLAVRVDGDGQHDPGQLDLVIAPVLRGDADIAVGSRFAAVGPGYRSSRTRRVGIRLLAWVVSRIVGQRVTDTTSGFQALNREGIALFARDYPHDYPEVEATVMVFRHRLRLTEVPVSMRERGGGRSSITALRSIYYMVKVLLAIFVGLFRRNVVPQEDSP